MERLFRELKSLLETRPIYHHWVKDNVKGPHLRVLPRALHRRGAAQKIEQLGHRVEREDLIRDLSQLRAIALRLDDDGPNRP